MPPRCPEWVVKLLSLTFHTLLVSIAAGLVLWWIEARVWGVNATLQPPVSNLKPLVWSYSALCLAIAAGPLARWACHRLFDRPAAVLQSNHTNIVDLSTVGNACPIQGPITTLLRRVPGNDFLRLHVQHKELALPRLPAALDGISIAHVSDLHFCGRLSRPFFSEVIRHVNALDADLIALTGDFFDRRECLDWIGDTLGRLRARHGAYFVLGNHDRYIGDVAGTRLRLTSAGLIDLGGRWLTIEIDGQSILLAGNELPWHRPAAPMENRRRLATATTNTCGFCCPTRPTNWNGPAAGISTSCWPATPTAARFACRCSGRCSFPAGLKSAIVRAYSTSRRWCCMSLAASPAKPHYESTARPKSPN